MLRQALATSMRSCGQLARYPSSTPALRFVRRLQAPQPQYTFLRPASPIPRMAYSSTAEGQELKAGVNSPAREPQQPEVSPAGSEGAATVEPTPDSALQKALDAKDKEMRAWKDKCLRQMAEYQNLQDRSARAQKQAREFAIQAFAKDLLENIDNLDRALGMVPEPEPGKDAPEADTEEQQDLANLHEGLRLTESGLMKTMERHGLVRFDPMGEPFNPNEHEATFMTPQPDKDNNQVFHVQQKGFKLNGRVLRAAKVGVVKNA